ncbi:hypothetical protein RD792_004103 [Penstemon davidsonii]|uniref:Phototropic-responsive NPH3 family protein n=1 Tax=Penstemon davidsonii TaxID=160366 RepID=A0ABR0DGI4_9LAMI|nr:hypothetical protein RD792_004103 [Penstemon davidsonii]
MAAEKPTSKGQAWFCTTGLPSDVIIEVDDMTFHLHKFPLMSKSRKLHDLITEQEKNQTTATNQNDQKFDNDTQQKDDEIEEEDEQHCHITLPDFPGGSESFETAAKFCYGVKIELSPTTAAPLRCAGEYLQMTEEYSEENLISKTERFLSHSVFKNIKYSLKALTSCQKLVPMAENLGILQRCIDAIASKSAAADPSLFGWPVNDGAAMKISETDSWLNELGNLSLPLFQHLIFAMKSFNVSVETIETCLIHYAKKFFPGISRTSRKPSSSSSSTLPSQNEQRELLETIISNLPIEKSSSSNTATRFLFGFLRASYILNASEGCRLTLEKRIGLQLEKASLDDLLIPSYSYLNETLYDVECVERILEYFLQGLEERSVSRSGIEDEDEDSGDRSAALMVVGKLIDGYLSEIASDANLKPEKFYDLAIALPDHARLFDDGLYRAVDVYLKAHPWVSEADREKICGILDCQKLTLEACTHAAQNERLPLRAVVQVLFFEQLQLRHAIAGTLVAAEPETLMEAAGRLSHGGTEEEEEEERAVVVARAPEGSSTWRAAVRENQVLRVDMDSMRTRVHELERECTTMRKAIQKIDKMEPKGHVEKGGWRNKFGCKFKTQVCDSHQPSVVEVRRGRNNRHEQ